MVKPWQLSELSLDSRSLRRASPLGSGWLSAIIPKTHGLTITCTPLYIIYNIYNVKCIAPSNLK